MTSFVVDDAAGWTPLTGSGLPASGVTAGTYGDSTHVGQVTVDAAGRVTAASAVAITGATLDVTDGSTTVSGVTDIAFTGATVSSGGGGVANVAVSGGGGGLALLYDSTLGADAAQIDTGAGGIAGGYKALMVFLCAKSADAGVTGSIFIRLNNDSGANYDDVFNYNGGNGNAAAATSWSFSIMGGGSSTGYPSSLTIILPNYAGTTFQKVADIAVTRVDGNTSNQITLAMAAGWRSTAAISRLAVIGNGANLKAGSRLTIYGTP